MKKLRWQFVILLVTGLVVGIVLITQQQLSSSQSNVATPVKGGSYTEGLVGSLTRLNPLLDEYNSADSDVDRLIYSSLFTFDANGNAVTDLADKIAISHDGTIYNISLKKNVTWQDGKPLTADDVVFTVNLLQKATSILPTDQSTFWKSVTIKKYSDTQVQFQLPEAYAPFMDYLTFGILPKHLLNNLTPEQIADSDFNLNPVGSGPYKFDHFLVENQQIAGVVLTANTSYYNQKPYIDEITFRYYQDDKTAFSAYKAGLIQGISDVGLDILPDVLKETNLSIYSSQRSLLTMVFFNLKNTSVPFFSDATLRNALMESLNRTYMVNQVYQGEAVLANGPIIPGNWAYYDGLQSIAYDPDLALTSLKSAGYTLSKDGQTLSTKDKVAVKFTLLYPDDATHKALAKIIQTNWAALGVQVDLKAVDYDDLVDNNLDPRTYEAALVDINTSSSPDPDPYPFWDQSEATGGQNYSQWNDENASQYLEDARTTTDTAERMRLYRNFQVLFQQQMPSLPLFYQVYTYAISDQIKGLQMGPIYKSSDRFIDVTDWFISNGQTNSASELTTKVPSATPVH